MRFLTLFPLFWCLKLPIIKEFCKSEYEFVNMLSKTRVVIWRQVRLSAPLSTSSVTLSKSLNLSTSVTSSLNREGNVHDTSFIDLRINRVYKCRELGTIPGT